jgi:hypothetical protein
LEEKNVFPKMYVELRTFDGTQRDYCLKKKDLAEKVHNSSLLRKPPPISWELAKNRFKNWGFLSGEFPVPV